MFWKITLLKTQEKEKHERKRKKSAGTHLILTGLSFFLHYFAGNLQSAHQIVGTIYINYKN